MMAFLKIRIQYPKLAGDSIRVRRSELGVSEFGCAGMHITVERDPPKSKCAALPSDVRKVSDLPARPPNYFRAVPRWILSPKLSPVGTKYL